MSRIGIKPITVPANVTVTAEGGLVTVKGPKGELTQNIASTLSVVQEGNTLTVERPDNARFNRAQHGLARTLISNMIQGVTEGHKKSLRVHGVGYRAALEGSTLILTVGYSHPVKMEQPAGIDFTVIPGDKQKVTEIVVAGIDKAQVGQVAADIRKQRKPDPYKGKGLRYDGEVVRLRPGKRAGK